MRSQMLLVVAMLVGGVGSATARAQAQPPAAPPPHLDSIVVHRLPVDPTRVQSSQSLYRLTLTRDSASTSIGDQRFVITALDYAGTPALMLARDGAQGVAVASDSLVVRRDDLRPLHWIGTHGVARVAAEFTSDTIFGAMTSPLGKQNVVLPNRADLLVNQMAVDVVLSALPLATAWRDSATMLVIDAGGAALTPATISVEGEEHVSVPAGEFDCWIVSLESERASAQFWVAKQSQMVVRSEQVLPEVGGATLTRVLVQTDSPAVARLPQ